MFEISKEFEFCYAHRVWKQELCPTHALRSDKPCRSIHGHNAIVKVVLVGEDLDKSDMLTDFHNLAWFKKFLDSKLDHKLILDFQDPALHVLFQDYQLQDSETAEGVTSININDDMSSLFTELYGGLALVDFCPTSEQFAKFFAELVEEKMKEFSNVISVRVEFKETPKSNAIYSKTTNHE